MPQVLHIGYFGKIPAAGDFVVRNVDRNVREGLDKWLQQAMEASRKALGDAWLHSFLTAPVWRFLSTGLGGQRTVLGVLIPSVDKVGRYFPFAILVELADLQPDARTLLDCDRLLDGLEPLGLSVLDDDFDLDHLGHQLNAISKSIGAGKYPVAVSRQEDVENEDVASLERSLSQLDWGNASVWWTEGSEFRSAEMLFHEGMPKPATFTSFLRDPNIFSDFEAVWDRVRHLAVMQNDNGHIEIGRSNGTWPVHAICHPGNNAGPNAGYAELSGDGRMLVLSDGRFGISAYAMISRLLCHALPNLWHREEKLLPSGELRRLIAFLSTRSTSQQSNLLPALSFAAIVQDEVQNRFHLAVAGDYLCLYSGRHGVTRLFSPDDANEADAPTVRRPANGLYAMVTIDLEPQDRLMIASGVLSARVSPDSLGATDMVSAAHALIQEPLIRGVGGNLAVAVIMYSAEAEQLK